MARPGDVVVVDAGGHRHRDRAVLGEIVARYAIARGVAGFIIDGVVRDAAEMAAAQMPVAAPGSCPLGPRRSGSGAIGDLIVLGRLPIACGDLVVADADGLAAVPRLRSRAVVEAAQNQLAREKRALSTPAPEPWTGGGSTT